MGILNNKLVSKCESLTKRNDEQAMIILSRIAQVNELEKEIEELKSRKNFRAEAEKLWWLVYDIHSAVRFRFDHIETKDQIEIANILEFVSTKRNVSLSIFHKTAPTSNWLETTEESRLAHERRLQHLKDYPLTEKDMFGGSERPKDWKAVPSSCADKRADILRGSRNG